MTITCTLRNYRPMASVPENKAVGDGQQEEINALREHFKDNIRILSSIGQFSYILKIRADPFDVSLTLQLDRKTRRDMCYIVLHSFPHHRIVSRQSTGNNYHCSSSYSWPNSSGSTSSSIIQRNVTEPTYGLTHLCSSPQMVRREQHSNVEHQYEYRNGWHNDDDDY